MKTLLIVEDEKMIRQGIRAIVSRTGVPIEEIIECKNGEEALGVLRERKVDVMLTDIRMPKMDGITLVKESQKLPEPPQTVVISGYDDFSYAVELLRQGVREYILKPVEKEKIAEILQKLEVEIVQKTQVRMDNTKMGYQQLKYVLLNQNIDEQELEMIQRQCADYFFQGSSSYHVICTNYGGEDLEDENLIFLKDVEQQNVFIAGNAGLERLKEETQDYYIGISEAYECMSELRKAYKEALHARKAAFFTEEKRVLFEVIDVVYDQIGEEEINRIVQMMATSNMDEINRIMESVILRAREKRVSYKEMEQAVESLIDKLYKNYKNVVDIDVEKGNYFKNFYRYETVSDFYQDFYGWLCQFCSGMATELEDYKNKQKIQTAIEYIHENYTKDLNMAVVSNHVSMNYSLFSFAFKQYTGTNFVYYLKKIRIEEAMKLLRDTEFKVADVAQRVGYDNEKYFMKTFKSLSGVSATEYRRNCSLK